MARGVDQRRRPHAAQDAPSGGRVPDHDPLDQVGVQRPGHPLGASLVPPLGIVQGAGPDRDGVGRGLGRSRDSDDERREGGDERSHVGLSGIGERAMPSLRGAGRGVSAGR